MTDETAPIRREILSHSPVFKRIEKFRESKGKYVPSGTKATV
jgi:hypothetical protein